HLRAQLGSPDGSGVSAGSTAQDDNITLHRAPLLSRSVDVRGDRISGDAAGRKARFGVRRPRDDGSQSVAGVPATPGRCLTPLRRRLAQTCGCGVKKLATPVPVASRNATAARPVFDTSPPRRRGASGLL